MLDDLFQINVNFLGFWESSIQERFQALSGSFPATPNLLILEPNGFAGKSRVACAIHFSIRSLKPIGLLEPAGQGLIGACEFTSGSCGSHVSVNAESYLS